MTPRCDDVAGEMRYRPHPRGGGMLYDAACRTWADRCFGELRRLPIELTYDPAATVELEPGTLWIAARSGQVFRLTSTARSSQLEQIALRGQIAGAIVCMAAGPRAGTLLVGTRHGVIHEIRDGAASELLRGEGRIAALRALPPSHGARVLVIDEARWLSLWDLRPDGAVCVSRERADWFPTWTESSFTSEASCLRMISADGRCVEIAVQGDSIRIADTTPIDGDIRALTFLQGSTREVVVASAGVLRFTPPDGANVQVVACDLEVERMWHLRLFDEELLLASARGGRLATVARRAVGACWKPTRETWPRLGADPLQLWVHAHRRTAAHVFVALRDRGVTQVTVHDHRPIRAVLASREDWSDVSDDPSRYAHLTIAPADVTEDVALRYAADGGQRTIDGVLRWLADERVASGALVRIGCRLLVSAARIDAARTVATARRLGDAVDGHLRAARGPGYERLLGFRRFLEKYFLQTESFDAKRVDLRHLIEVNEQHATADALVYSARLRRQGYDRLQTLDQPGVWSIATTRRQGTTQIAVAAGNGDVWTSDVSETAPLTPVYLRRGTAFQPRGILPSPPYSRVIAFAGSQRVLIAPRPGGAPLTREDSPDLEVVGGFSDVPADGVEFYSVCELGSDRFVLGTRDPERPFLVYDMRAREASERVRWLGARVRDLPAPRGYTERRVNRIWTITPLTPSWLVAGFEDGCLRVMGRTPWTIGTQGYAVELKSAVRVTATFRNERHTMLAVGTERGTLAVFRVHEENDAPELILKFRDELRDAIVAVFSDAPSPAEPASRIYALTQAGRLFAYEAGVSRSGQRLGHRYRHYQVWSHGSCAAYLGDNVVAVGGWNPTERNGALVLIRIASHVRERPAPLHVRHAIQDFGRFEPESPEQLLAAVPLADPSLRAVVADRAVRFAESLDAEPGLRSAIVTARAAYPDDLDEVKTIIDAAMTRIHREHRDDEWAAATLRTLFQELVGPDGRFRFGGRESPELAAAAVRRMLTGPVLRLWARSGLEHDRLVRWIQGLMHSHVAFVRLETARALSEALGGLLAESRRDPRVISDAFPAARDGAVRGVWVLDCIAHCLVGRRLEGRGGGSEIDPLGWAATSVMVALLRLLDDSTLKLLDALCDRNVDGSVLRLVGARLTHRRDHLLIRRIAFYWPWDSTEPSHAELLEVCGRRYDPESLGIADDGQMADGEYLRAARRHYEHFEALLKIQSESALEDLAKRLNTQKAPQATGGESGCLRRVAQWRAACFETLAGGSEEVARAVSSQQSPLWRQADALPGPARPLALGVLASWRRVLRLEVLIGRESIGLYELEAPFRGSPSVFSVRDRPDILIGTVMGASDVLADQILSAWQRLRELASRPTTTLVPVHDVLRDPPFVALVMSRLQGRSLKACWGGLIAMPPKTRLPRARTICEQLLEQLAELHSSELYHDDIVRRNVLEVDEPGGGARYYLVDFGRVAGSPTGDEHIELDADADSVAERLWQHRHRWRQHQLHDVEQLFQIVAHLLAQQPKMNVLSSGEPVRRHLPEELPAQDHAWIEWFDTVRRSVTDGAGAATLLRESRAVRGSPPVRASRRLVFLSANQDRFRRLDIEVELRLLQDALREAPKDHAIELVHQPDLHLHDVSRSLEEPTILLHVSAHGDETGAILMKSHIGALEPMAPRALAELIGNRDDASRPRVVVLMSCFSKVLAQELRRHVDVVVGTTGEIDDDAASLFTKEFYGALADGRDVGAAFSSAMRHVRAIVDARGGNASRLIKLYRRKGVDATTVIPFPRAAGRSPGFD